MEKRLNIEIPATWQFVRNVKRMVEDVLKEHSEKVRYSAGMVASELVGNAIKYADHDGGYAPPRMQVVVTDDLLSIEVTNAVRSVDDWKEVEGRIERMSKSRSKEEFYLNRLQELLNNPSKQRGSQLGLYRIGYEGEFALSCTYAEKALTIRAVRGLL